MALKQGRVPSEYVEAHTMHETGLSWQELQETPADVISRLMLYRQVRNAIETKSALTFPDAQAT